MKKLLFLLPLLFAFPAWGGPPEMTVGGEYSGTPPVLTDKQRTMLQFDAAGNVKTVAAGTPSGTQDVNLKQVGGATTAVGHGVAATALRVELPTDGTGVVGLIAGAAVIGHVIVDAGAAVIGHVILDASAAVIGHVILDASAAVIGHVIVDSGTITAVTAITNALPVGANVIGKVSIDQTTPGTTNAVQDIPGISGGLSSYVVEPTASDNHVVIKAGAGQVYHIAAFNNSATVNYVRLYNATTGFNGCNSATNLMWEGNIPASSSGSGFVEDIAQGIAFSTGISICVTGTYGNTSTANATASVMSVNIGYK